MDNLLASLIIIGFHFSFFGVNVFIYLFVFHLIISLRRLPRAEWLQWNHVAHCANAKPCGRNHACKRYAFVFLDFLSCSCFWSTSLVSTLIPPFFLFFFSPPFLVDFDQSTNDHRLLSIIVVYWCSSGGMMFGLGLSRLDNAVVVVNSVFLSFRFLSLPLSPSLAPSPSHRDPDLLEHQVREFFSASAFVAQRPPCGPGQHSGSLLAAIFDVVFWALHGR